jgi:hypothetical protein
MGQEKGPRADAQSPFNNSDIFVFNPRAITCEVMIPISRFPCSMSEMCSAHVQAHGHIGLSPPLAFTQIPDPLAEFH